MFKMMDGVNALYQWDLNRKLVVEDDSINEVHFCHKKDENALVCEVYESDGVRLVDVPNILLQSGSNICAYAYRIDHTVFEKVFNVHRRVKPEDYVYTETEVKSYETLDARIKFLEDKPAEINAEDVTQIVKDKFAGGVGYVEATEGEILPETSFEVILKGGVGMTFISESFPYTFEIGEEYIVTFDGEAESYTAIDDNRGTVGIINTSLADFLAGNGWLMAVDSGRCGFMTMDTSLVGAHTISISGSVHEVHKIDRKFIPDMPLYVLASSSELAASENGTALEPNELAELLKTKHCYIIKPSVDEKRMEILSYLVFRTNNVVDAVKCYFIDSSTGSIRSTQNGETQGS